MAGVAVVPGERYGKSPAVATASPTSVTTQPVTVRRARPRPAVTGPPLHFATARTVDGALWRGAMRTPRQRQTDQGLFGVTA
ncbi:MAG: hypothetical protein QOD57_2681 [Actinomycetota bacterium]|nr:hypothetical protein [Actinomycetota bacterium]